MDKGDLLTFTPFSTSNLRIVISLHSAGDMGRESRDNREILYRSLGISHQKVWTLKQIHSKTVIAVPPLSRDTPLEGDGLVSGEKEHVLGVTVADCLPIFLADQKGRCFGAFHSGWKGTGIVLEGLELMKEQYGVNPEQIEAFIGPSIGPCCYRVDLKRQELFRNRYGERSLRGESLDLPRVNSSLLQGAGVPMRQITIEGSCTCCDGRFGSFRREGPDGFTRMLALIGYFQ